MGCCKVGCAKPWLLEFDLRAGGLEFLLDLLGLLFGHALLDGFWRALDQILGLFETQAGNGTDLLDGADLVRSAFDENDGVFALFLGGGRRRGSAPSSRG